MSNTQQIIKNSNKSKLKQNLDFYLNLKYPITFYPDEEEGYTAEIKDLPGCLTQGETMAEVEANIHDARRLWIEVAYENGDRIPLPITENSYSGKTLLRMPISLHRQLVEEAKEEGISLNQYSVFQLTKRHTEHFNFKQIKQIFTSMIMSKTSNIIQGTKEGNHIVFNPEACPEIAKLDDGTKVNIEISEEQMSSKEKLEKIEEIISNSPWKDGQETEEDIRHKIDKSRK